MPALELVQTASFQGEKLQSLRVSNGTGTTKIKPKDSEFIPVSLAVPRHN